MHTMSDYDAMQKRRNFVVGLFVVIALFSFGWMVFRFSDLPAIVTKLNSFDVYVQFTAAPGVQKDTPVRFCGYQIGRVTYVEPPRIMAEITRMPPPRWYHQTKVTLSIDKQYETIPAASQVKLMTRGLGSSFIEIKAPLPELNKPVTEFFKQGYTLQGSSGITSEFFPEEIQKKLEYLVDDLRSFVGNTNNIVSDPDNQRHVKTTLSHIAGASKELNKTLLHAQGIIEKGSETLAEYKTLAITGTTTLEHTDQQVERLALALVNTSEELTKVGSEMRLMVSRINAGEGTLGNFLHNASFYENMLVTTEQLQVLINQLTAVVEAIGEKGISRVWKKGTK